MRCQWLWFLPAGLTGILPTQPFYIYWKSMGEKWEKAEGNLL